MLDPNQAFKDRDFKAPAGMSCTEGQKQAIKAAILASKKDYPIYTTACKQLYGKYIPMNFLTHSQAAALLVWIKQGG